MGVTGGRIPHHYAHNSEVTKVLLYTREQAANLVSHRTRSELPVVQGTHSVGLAVRVYVIRDGRRLRI